MNPIYCCACHIRTPRNFADENMYDGVYCKKCANRLGYLPTRPAPPTTGTSVQKPVDREALWELNLKALDVGAFGDPCDFRTMLRYWRAQEAAGYPGAQENVQYFTDLIENTKGETNA